MGALAFVCGAYFPTPSPGSLGELLPHSTAAQDMAKPSDPPPQAQGGISPRLSQSGTNHQEAASPWAQCFQDA